MKVIFQNQDLLVIDKPAHITIEELREKLSQEYSFLKNLPRAGIVHRLDKDTSGLLLVAKNQKFLDFLQKQFKERKVEKKYLCLVTGNTDKQGEIKTLIGRNPNNRLKQKVYLFTEPNANNKREAVTRYKKIKELENYSLLEVFLSTGRKHQIRCHMAYLNHPVVGDKIYGFKNQKEPKGLTRHFLHAYYLKINNQEFHSELPEELKKILKYEQNRST